MNVSGACCSFGISCKTFNSLSNWQVVWRLMGRGVGRWPALHYVFGSTGFAHLALAMVFAAQPVLAQLVLGSGLLFPDSCSQLAI